MLKIDDLIFNIPVLVSVEVLLDTPYRFHLLGSLEKNILDINVYPRGRKRHVCVSVPKECV